MELPPAVRIENLTWTYEGAENPSLNGINLTVLPGEHERHGSIQLYPGKSFLHRLDPRTKLIAFLVITFSAVQITDPIVMASMLVVIVLLSVNSHIPLRRSASLLYRLLPLLIFYFIFNMPLNPLNLQMVQNPTKIIFYLIPFTKLGAVSGEGVIFAVAMLFRFALIVYALQILITFTTQTVDISRALIK